MDDLISRREATSIPVPKEYGKIFESIADAFETGWNEALSCVNMLPPAYERKNAEPVRHGKWIEQEDWGDTYYDCSVCGESFVLLEGTPRENLYYYCPNCGAKMDKDSTEDDEGGAETDDGR